MAFNVYAGEGMGELSLADRATIANMSPEYGATMGFFPVDHVTLQYLKLTGRKDETVSNFSYCRSARVIHFCFYSSANLRITIQISMIESYLRANKMFVDYSEVNIEYPLSLLHCHSFTLFSNSIIVILLLCQHPSLSLSLSTSLNILVLSYLS